MPDVPLEVSFRYDAPELTPQALAEDLCRVARKDELKVDAYMRGGSVAVFEEAFAELLGKERAVLMPTGTLANHLVVRALARGRNRILVQERGHLYNDCGDCLQQLSGFNAIPLGADRATFTLEEVQDSLRAAEEARVQVGVGALVIETPVRRKYGERFDHDEMLRICGFARGQGIGLHLDGARILIASAYTGISAAAYAAPFDTVYVSLYKYLGTPCGAVLAGPDSLLESIHHERRMFGGALNQGWMFAAVALEHLREFPARFSHVVEASEAFKESVRKTQGLSIFEIPNGTNVCRMELPEGMDPAGFRARMRELGILLPLPERGGFYLKMNESILALPAETLVGRFAQALQREAHG